MSPLSPSGLSIVQILRRRVARLGAGALGDEELIALLLETGAQGASAVQLARRILEQVGGVAQLGRLSAHALNPLPGIGPGKAARVLAGIELGKRVVEGALGDSTDDELTPSSYEQIVRWARPRLVPLRHEEVWLLSLDGRNFLRSTRRVAQGGLHGCALLPADVLRPAIEEAASAIVVVHNHPSGDPTPSRADRTMTLALRDACDVVGLVLVDHVVVAKGGAVSMRDLNLV